MSGTKIIVVSLKEIIRTALFAIVGIAIALLLIYLFLPKEDSSNASLYKPGVYTSEILLHNSPAYITVEVDDNNILDISLTELSDVQQVFYPLLAPTTAEINAQVQSSGNTSVSTTINNMHTTRLVMSGVNDCLAQAEYPISTN